MYSYIATCPSVSAASCPSVRRTLKQAKSQTNIHIFKHECIEIAAEEQLFAEAIAKTLGVFDLQTSRNIFLEGNVADHITHVYGYAIVPQRAGNRPPNARVMH